MKIALAPILMAPYRGNPKSPTYKNDRKTMLKRIRQTGYDGIEMGTPEGFTNEEYKAYLDEIGLEVASANGGLDLEAGDFSAKLEECRVLGAKNVMVSNVPPVVLGNQEELRKFIASLNRAGKILMEEGGVHLSFHNHAIDFSKINGKSMLEQVIEGTDPRYVFFEPDTHWIQAGGGHVISWLKKLRGRMYIVHFKDYAIDPYSDHTFLECTHKVFAEVGLGNLNWPGILAEVKAQGIGWCAVEQDQAQRPPYEAIKISIDNLRGMGA